MLLGENFRAWDMWLFEGPEAAGYEDIRPAHYAVFRYLEPEGSRVTELAEAARITKQSMGELVAHLERCGYVERRPDPRDRRAKIVLLTKAGRQFVDAVTERVAQMEAALAQRMGRERLEDLAASLEDLQVLLVELSPMRANHTRTS